MQSFVFMCGHTRLPAGVLTNEFHDVVNGCARLRQIDHGVEHMRHAVGHDVFQFAATVSGQR